MVEVVDSITYQCQLQGYRRVSYYIGILFPLIHLGSCPCFPLSNDELLETSLGSICDALGIEDHGLYGNRGFKAGQPVRLTSSNGHIATTMKSLNRSRLRISILVTRRAWRWGCGGDSSSTGHFTYSPSKMHRVSTWTASLGLHEQGVVMIT